MQHADLGTALTLPSLLLPFRFQWWLVPMPFGLLIFVYDEIRKLGVRCCPGSECGGWRWGWGVGGGSEGWGLNGSLEELSDL